MINTLAYSKKLTEKLRTILSSAIIISLLLILPCLTGCGLISGTSNSPYDVSFVKGELISKVDEPLEVVWKATQKVAEESQFLVKSNRADAFSAVLKSEDAQQRKIEITLEKESEKFTRIKIRVGLLGDAELSGKIFEQLEKELQD